MPARRLTARQIGDVTEQTAHRRAQRMEYVQRQAGAGGHAAVNPSLNMRAGGDGNRRFRCPTRKEGASGRVTLCGRDGG
jgi:hypothetical protein